MSISRGWCPSKAVYGPAGSSLTALKPWLDVEACAFGGEIGVVVDVLVGVLDLVGVDAAAVRIEVGVGAQRLVHLPAEQLVDRLVGFLADDVPAGDFQRGEAAHHGDVRALREARRIGAAEEVLDVVRIAPDEIALGEVLDHPRRDMRAERCVVRLAVADDAAVGGELHEDEIAAADAGRRVADNPGLDVGDFHARLRDLGIFSPLILQHHVGALGAGDDRRCIGVAADVERKHRRVDDAQVC